MNRELDARICLLETGSMRATIHHMLRKAGFKNIEAVTITPSVLQHLADASFDAILLGHSASDPFSGIQLLEEARFRGVMRSDVVWLFMTGDAAQEVVLHAVDCRPDGVIVKPFSIEVLAQRMRQLLRVKRELKPLIKAFDQGDFIQLIRTAQAQLMESSPLSNELRALLAEAAIKLGDFALARRYADYLNDAGNKEGALLSARAMVGQRDIAGAIDVVEGCIARYPMFLAAYDLLAVLYELKGQLGMARDTLVKAVSASPLAVPRQNEVGRLAEETGEYPLAEASYRRSILHGRRSCYRTPEPYLRLLNIKRIELGVIEGARSAQVINEVEQIALMLERSFPRDEHARIRASLLKSGCFAMIGDGPRSKQCIDQAIKVNQSLDDPLDLSLEREALKEPPKPQGALLAEMLAMGESSIERDAERLNKQGVTIYLSGELVKARKYFELALREDPAFYAARLNLAQIVLEQLASGVGVSANLIDLVDQHLGLLEEASIDQVYRPKLATLRSVRRQWNGGSSEFEQMGALIR